MNKVLIIGKGKGTCPCMEIKLVIALSAKCSAPGNPGIANENKVSTISIEVDDINELVKFAKEEITSQLLA